MSFLIDEHTLQKCLAMKEPQDRNSKPVIKNFTQICGVATVANNYTSEIIRLKIDYEFEGESKTAKFIAKVPLLSANYKFLQKIGFYETEAFLYDAILPKIADLLKYEVAPHHYCTIDSENLILEDLTESGYEVEGNEVFNLEQSRVTIKTLAKFHAASFKVRQCHKRFNASLTSSLSALFTRGVVQRVATSCYPALIDLLKCEGVLETSIQNFEHFREDLFNKSLYDIANRSANLVVLNHDELKCHNILFKYNENGEPISAKFVDYQTSHWNAPVFDILFFSSLSIPFSAFEKHFEELLNDYLDILNQTLEELDCGAKYTKNDFESDAQRVLLFRIFTLLWSGFMTIRAEIKKFDVGENYVPLSEEEIQKIQKSPHFRGGFLKWFRYYEETGVFWIQSS